ncbi:MAG: transposase [Gammaproteobacteria bacterium]
MLGQLRPVHPVDFCRTIPTLPHGDTSYASVIKPALSSQPLYRALRVPFFLPFIVDYTKRLRCWAHRVRKARGLAESWVPSSQRFGQHALEVLQTLMQAVYEARESPGGDLKAKYPHQLDAFRGCCERYQDAEHEKTRELAREFLNDWEAIFAVLSHPQRPLTHNQAERALRHWVILRKLSLGTRSEQGSRALALLASVIDTCRQRGVSPWTYLAEVIRLRRQGLDAPPLPTAA